jgi:transposase
MEPLSLTHWQRRHLESQLRSTFDARVYRRTLAILEVAAGESVPSVAHRLRVTPRAVYHWLAAYTADPQPSVLVDAHRSGRPTLLADSDRDVLQELLADNPQDVGYAATAWTVPLLQQHLLHETGQQFSEDTIRRELRRLQYSWKRPRYRLEPDPEARGKKAAYPHANQAVAAPQRHPGPGRDRPVALPAAAVVLVAGRPTTRGVAVGP